MEEAMKEKKSKTSVLIVDDEESIGLGISEILKDEGLDAFREIKKIRPGAKVILFTGYFRDAESYIAQGVKEGMIDEFIRKPYFADEVIRSAKKHATI